jgi:hypothetical protein
MVAKKKNPFELANKPTGQAMRVGSFWDELRRRGKSERSEKLDLSPPWIRDYCDIISDLDRSLVVVAGASQIGKSIFNFYNGFWLAMQGYRVLIMLPTRESVQRNIRIQIEPIADHWDTLSIIGQQQWQSKGGGVILFGNTSTSGSGSDTAKSRGGLANVGGSASSVSVDFIIADEFSQMSAEATAVLPRRMDRGAIPSRPQRLIGTMGAGGGIERLISKEEHLWPTCPCESCGHWLPLDLDTCFFKSKLPSGWISEWSTDELGFPCIACPACNAPVRNHLAKTRIRPPESGAIGLQLSPLLRSGDPARQLIDSMELAQRNGNSSADWYQQALGLPSQMSGILRVAMDTIKMRPVAMAPNSFVGVFVGIDQGIGNQYCARVAVFKTVAGLPVFKILGLEAGGEVLISEYCQGAAMALIDTKPDRTLAAQMAATIPGLELAEQKYTIGAIRLRGEIQVGDYKEPCVQLPVTGHLTLLEAFADGRVSVDCPVTPMVSKHLTAIFFDQNRRQLIRPADHGDDLWFALYFAASAYLAREADAAGIAG